MNIKLQNDYIGDSVILHKLKQKVIDLAVTPGVVYSVQSVAQSVLRAGWILLLPTADERARALSLLLPGNQKYSVSIISIFIYSLCKFNKHIP